MTSPDATPSFNGTSPFPTPSLEVSSAGISHILVIAFFLIFVVWLIYTAVASYHWFRYGHRSWLAIPAVALHIFVSGFCIFYMALSLA